MVICINVCMFVRESWECGYIGFVVMRCRALDFQEKSVKVAGPVCGECRKYLIVVERITSYWF